MLFNDTEYLKQQEIYLKLAQKFGSVIKCFQRNVKVDQRDYFPFGNYALWLSVSNEMWKLIKGIIFLLVIMLTLIPVTLLCNPIYTTLLILIENVLKPVGAFTHDMYIGINPDQNPFQEMKSNPVEFGGFNPD